MAACLRARSSAHMLLYQSPFLPVNLKRLKKAEVLVPSPTTRRFDS